MLSWMHELNIQRPRKTVILILSENLKQAIGFWAKNEELAELAAIR